MYMAYALMELVIGSLARLCTDCAVIAFLAIQAD